MAQKEGSTKSKRDHKESKGLRRGAKKTHLTPLQLILMGKGMVHQSKSRGGINPSRRPRSKPEWDA